MRIVLLNDLSDLFFDSYLGGIIWILLGVVMIWFTKKYPQEKPSSLAGDLRGWVSGIMFIVGGAALLLLKLFGQ